MFSLFINGKPWLFFGLLMILVGCVGGNTSVKYRGSEARSPVAISAALQNDFKKALALMKKEKYEDAIPLLEAILAKNDQLPGTHINLAIAYMNVVTDDDKENLSKAERSLLRAVEVNPKDAVAHHQLGLLYRKTGRFKEAQTAYQRALSLKPDYAKAHLNLGILCDIYLQEFECAIKHFEQYSGMAGEDRETVSLWLSDLRRRAGIPEPPQQEQAAVSEVSP